MSEDRLLLGPLRAAVDSLARAPGRPQDEFMRDTVIKRFEYTYELAWKFMRRHLRLETVAPEPATRRDLFRDAARAGLIDAPERWFAYHDARNLTSHTYDERTAAKVAAVVPEVLDAARGLLAALERIHGDRP